VSAKPSRPDLGRIIGEALALHQQGRLDEAATGYRRVLKAQPDHFDALHLLGVLNTQRGDPAEAHRLITAALKVNPRSPDALSNLALALHALKRSAEALASLDRALALAPGHAEALNNRGNILLDQARATEAVAAFDVILAANPRQLQALINRGNALVVLDRSEQAIADYDAALALAPGHPLALYNRGNALRALGRDGEAIAAYEAAVAGAPNYVNAWLNRGLALAALNRHQDALSSYARVRELAPEFADVHFNAALSLLTLGDYRRGFAEYEWRWRRTGMIARQDLRAPLWLGETPLAGKTILLHAEQGLGDTVMFARYVPRLARLGAKIALEVQPELVALLATLDSAAAVVGRGQPLPAHDLHCPLASLPLALKTEPTEIPAEFPYLRAAEPHLSKWRARLDGVPAPRVALVWSGGATHANDRRRSLALEQLEPLLSVSGVRFISLQREPRDACAARLGGETRITHLGGELADFADTAAILTLVDQLVCVDTSVVHVAGALGRSALVLLPFQPDWRWTLERERSPWYPTLKLFRQPSPGDWAAPIARVRDELLRLS